MSVLDTAVVFKHTLMYVYNTFLFAGQLEVASMTFASGELREVPARAGYCVRFCARFEAIIDRLTL